MLSAVKNNKIDFDDYYYKVGNLLKKLGSKKGVYSRKGMKKDKMEEIKELTNEIKTLQKHQNRIKIVPEGLKTVTGKGIYTQPKQ